MFEERARPGLRTPSPRLRASFTGIESNKLFCLVSIYPEDSCIPLHTVAKILQLEGCSMPLPRQFYSLVVMTLSWQVANMDLNPFNWEKT